MPLPMKDPAVEDRQTGRRKEISPSSVSCCLYMRTHLTGALECCTRLAAVSHRDTHSDDFEGTQGQAAVLDQAMSALAGGPPHQGAAGANIRSS